MAEDKVFQLPGNDSDDALVLALRNNAKKRNGEGVLENANELVDRGYTAYNFIIGAVYEIGKYGIDKDINKAKYFYEKAIGTGKTKDAYLGLARVYYAADSRWRDYDRAYEIYNKVIDEYDHNDSVACYMLGRMFFLGHGVDVDYEKAGSYFQRGWTKGYLPCLFHIGRVKIKQKHYVHGAMLYLKSLILSLIKPKRSK